MIWVIGLVGVTLLATRLAPVADEGGLHLLIWLLACFAIGIVAELATLAGSLRSRKRRLTPAGAGPADGTVELVSVVGVRSVPNARDPKLGRFAAIEAAQPVSEPPAAKETPILLGQVAILSVFLGRDGKAWTDEEIARAHESLRLAGDWIEREAMRWGAAVNLAVADTYFAVDDDPSDDVEIAFVPEGDGSAPLEAHAGPKALAAFSRAAARLGFADAEAMIQVIDRRVRADSWVWLLHPRCAGRSLAIPEGDTPWPGVTLAVCYAREANFPEPLRRAPYSDPVTFAHELLHLFGATDKYTVPLRTFPARSVTDRDIMRLSYESLGRLRIDQLTAAEVGWPQSPRA
jgi:hypothetical protein